MAIYQMQEDTSKIKVRKKYAKILKVILKGSNKLEILVSWTITWYVGTMIYHALFSV